MQVEGTEQEKGCVSIIPPALLCQSTHCLLDLLPGNKYIQRTHNAHLLSSSRAASPCSPGYARYVPTSSRLRGLYVRLLRLDNNMTPDMTVLA
jgi:hypothetical protein